MAKNPQVSNKLDFEKLKVFGLVANIAIHRVAWYLNGEFDWDLERVGEISFQNDNYIIVKTEDEHTAEIDVFSFPLHTFKDEDSKFDVDVVYNKSNKGSFLQEFKQFDYLLLIHGEFDYLPEKMLERLKRISPVQVAMEIPTGKIKERHLLVSYK